MTTDELIKNALELCGTRYELEAGLKHRLLSELAHALSRAEAERDAALKQSAAWEIQAQDFRDRAVRAEAERDGLRARLSEREEECRELESRRLMADRAYCDVSRRLDEEERERKEDRARAMAFIDQEKRYHAEELDELRALGWALICDGTNTLTALDFLRDRRREAETRANEAEAVAGLNAQELVEQRETIAMLTRDLDEALAKLATLRFLHNGGH